MSRNLLRTTCERIQPVQVSWAIIQRACRRSGWESSSQRAVRCCVALPSWYSVRRAALRVVSRCCFFESLGVMRAAPSVSLGDGTRSLRASFTASVSLPGCARRWWDPPAGLLRVELEGKILTLCITSDTPSLRAKRAAWRTSFHWRAFRLLSVVHGSSSRVCWSHSIPMRVADVVAVQEPRFAKRLVRGRVEKACSDHREPRERLSG